MTEQTETTEQRAERERAQAATQRRLREEYDDAVTRGGKLKRFSRRVQLSLSKGEIYPTGKKGRDHQFAIAADGYYEVNRVARMFFVDPKTVSVDGLERTNPFVVRKGPHVELVYVSAGLFGRGKDGALAYVSATQDFSPYQRFIRSLAEKAAPVQWRNDPAPKFNPSFRLVPTAALTGGSAPEWYDPAGWIAYPYDEQLSIAVDLASADVGKALLENARMQEFAVRRTQTVAHRRAAQKHPGMPAPKVHVDPGHITSSGESGQFVDEALAFVDVVAWVEERDLDLITFLQAMKNDEVQRIEYAPADTEADAAPEFGTVIDAEAESAGEEEPAKGRPMPQDVGPKATAQKCAELRGALSGLAELGMRSEADRIRATLPDDLEQAAMADVVSAIAQVDAIGESAQSAG